MRSVEVHGGRDVLNHIAHVDCIGVIEHAVWFHSYQYHRLAAVNSEHAELGGSGKRARYRNSRSAGEARPPRPARMQATPEIAITSGAERYCSSTPPNAAPSGAAATNGPYEKKNTSESSVTAGT